MSCGCGGHKQQNGSPADPLAESSFRMVTRPTWQNVLAWLTFFIAVIGFLKSSR